MKIINILIVINLLHYALLCYPVAILSESNIIILDCVLVCDDAIARQTDALVAGLCPGVLVWCHCAQFCWSPCGLVPWPWEGVDCGSTVDAPAFWGEW